MPPQLGLGDTGKFHLLYLAYIVCALLRFSLVASLLAILIVVILLLIIIDVHVRCVVYPAHHFDRDRGPGYYVQCFGGNKRHT